MLEIRFHGRGGQGTVLAAKMLAEAVLLSGRGECLAIPEFGVERRGAPVLAYARISRGKILARTRIYRPDAVVILDPALVGSPAVVQGLKAGGAAIACWTLPAELLQARLPSFRVLAVPARRIAQALGLGPAASPMVNTAMVGAVAAFLELADLDSVEAAVRAAVPGRVEENVAAAREAFEHGRREVPYAPA